jgi:hypothetical protein
LVVTDEVVWRMMDVKDDLLFAMERLVQQAFTAVAQGGGRYA